MASRFEPDPTEDSFFAQESQPVGPTTSRPLREDSAEEEIVTPTRPAQHPVVHTSLTADQWTMIHNIQNMRILLSTMETVILRQRFTVAHHLVLMRWQRAHLGPSLGHPDVALWVEANSILR